MFVSLENIDLSNKNLIINSPKSVIAMERLGVQMKELYFKDFYEYKRENPQLNSQPEELARLKWELHESLREQTIKVLKEERLMLKANNKYDILNDYKILSASVNNKEKKKTKIKNDELIEEYVGIKTDINNKKINSNANVKINSSATNFKGSNIIFKDSINVGNSEEVELERLKLKQKSELKKLVENEIKREELRLYNEEKMRSIKEKHELKEYIKLKKQEEYFLEKVERDKKLVERQLLERKLIERDNKLKFEKELEYKNELNMKKEEMLKNKKIQEEAKKLKQEEKKKKTEYNQLMIQYEINKKLKEKEDKEKFKQQLKFHMSKEQEMKRKEMHESKLKKLEEIKNYNEYLTEKFRMSIENKSKLQSKKFDENMYLKKVELEKRANTAKIKEAKSKEKLKQLNDNIDNRFKEWEQKNIEEQIKQEIKDRIKFRKMILKKKEYEDKKKKASKIKDRNEEIISIKQNKINDKIYQKDSYLIEYKVKKELMTENTNQKKLEKSKEKKERVSTAKNMAKERQREIEKEIKLKEETVRKNLGSKDLELRFKKKVKKDTEKDKKHILAEFMKMKHKKMNIKFIEDMFPEDKELLEKFKGKII